MEEKGEREFARERETRERKEDCQRRLPEKWQREREEAFEEREKLSEGERWEASTWEAPIRGLQPFFLGVKSLFCPSLMRGKTLFAPFLKNRVLHQDLVPTECIMFRLLVLPLLHICQCIDIAMHCYFHFFFFHVLISFLF